MRTAALIAMAMLTAQIHPVIAEQAAKQQWNTTNLSEFGIHALIDVPAQATIREPRGIFSLPGEVSIWISDATRNYRIRLGNDMAACFDASCDYKEALTEHELDKITQSKRDNKGWFINYERMNEDATRCRQVRIFQNVEKGISCDSTACVPEDIAKRILRICRSIRPGKP